MFPIKVYEYLAAVVALAALTGFVYWKGGEASRAELASLTTSIKNAQRLHEAEDKQREAQTKAVITEKDAEYAKSIENIGRGYESYIGSLRRPAGNGLSLAHAQPIGFPTSLCRDPAADQIVLGAFQKYQRDISAAVDDYRTGVGRLLGQADKNTAQLINLQDAIAKIQAINK